MASQPNCIAFNSGKELAICSQDGVLHLWDVGSGTKRAEYTPASHLTSTFTCLSWKMHRQKDHTNSKKKVKNFQKDDESILSLGTAVGEILIYHAQNGELIGKLDGGHSDKVNCVCWDTEDEYCLYSCSEDQHIVHWDLNSYKSICKWQADKRGVSSICMGPHSTLLSAGRTIKLWDLNTKKMLRKFTGHTSSVFNLTFVNTPCVSQRQDATPIDLVEGLYFLSAAIEDRVISAWQIQKRHRKIAVATFSLPSEPVFMTIRSPDKKEKSIYLLVLTEDGELHIFSHTLNGQIKKPLKAQKSIKVVDPSANPLKITASSFCNDSDNVLIAYGTTLRIVIERLNINDFETEEICLIREDPMKTRVVLSKDVTKKRQPIKKESEVTTLVPGLPGHSEKIENRELTDSRRKHKRKKTLSMSETEMSMEDRLNAIGLKQDGEKEVNPPRADSLSVLLSQGLQSNDKEILNRVLQHTNDNLIQNTLRRLPLPCILPLVQDLSIRLKTTPDAAFKFVKWLRMTLKIHSSYLMTFPDLVPTLSQLYQTMSTRTQTHTKFIKLEGKLDLIASQIKMKQSSSGPEVESTPMLVYEDESSDEQDDVLLDDLPIDHSDSSDNDLDDFSDKDDNDLVIDEEVDMVNGETEED